MLALHAGLTWTQSSSPSINTTFHESGSTSRNRTTLSKLRSLRDPEFGRRGVDDTYQWMDWRSWERRKDINLKLSMCKPIVNGDLPPSCDSYIQTRRSSSCTRRHIFQLHVLLVLLQRKVPSIVLSDGTGLLGTSLRGSDETSYLAAEGCLSKVLEHLPYLPRFHSPPTEKRTAPTEQN